MPKLPGLEGIAHPKPAIEHDRPPYGLVEGEVDIAVPARASFGKAGAVGVIMKNGGTGEGLLKAFQPHVLHSENMRADDLIPLAVNNTGEGNPGP